MKKLSIIIPVYNEKETITKVIEAVKDAPACNLLKEIIVVDDGSTDGTRETLKQFESASDIRIILHERNIGKGGAVRSGFKEATGDIILIQDADLEYNPKEYQGLLEPILEGFADVVYGSRFKGNGPHRVLYSHHHLGNRLVTAFSNVFTGLNLSDMETCYKVMKREVVEDIRDTLVSHRFGIEPEITARIARGKWRVYEIGIAYYGRTYDEGKKINWKDGVAALWHIVRFNVLDR